MDLRTFTARLSDWLDEVEKELPAPSQMSAMVYVRQELDRLGLDLHKRVIVLPKPAELLQANRPFRAPDLPTQVPSNVVKGISNAK